MKAYPDYKDSGVGGLGNVPSHWGVYNLKRLTQFVYGDSLSKENRTDGKIPVYGSNGIVGFHDEAIATSPCIVIGRKGSFGKVNFSAVECFPIDTTYFIDERATSNNIRWLYYVLLSLKLDAFSKDSAVPGLSREDAYERRTALPSLLEQQAIADFLDRKTAQIDALIEKKQRQIDLLQEQRTALINHAVTKGLNPKVKMMDSGVEWYGEIPQHWESKRLGWITSIIMDIDHKMPLAVEEGVPFLSAKDLLNDGTLNFDKDVKKISEEDFKKLSRKVQPKRNDIIYSRIGARLGKARLVETDQKFLVSYSCCVVRVIEEMALPEYICFIMDSEILLTEAKARTVGIGVPDLGLGEIAKFPIPLPPRPEQEVILEFLKKNDAKIKTGIKDISKQIDLLNEYRTALISEAVTGKIDVRERI